jgi:hypothetical protein
LAPAVSAFGDIWEDDRSAFSLVQSVQQSGYRSVAIGRMTDDDTSQWEEAIAVENRHYETRSITEEAGRWLERNGETPFFMSLHYATFRSPFRPPFEDLSVWEFLRSPFGYGAEAALERGLAKFFDKEFARIIGKLEALGILSDVDIAFVGVHGTQMSLLDYSKVMTTTWPGKAAVRSRSFLTRDELSVPFFVVRGGYGNEHSRVSEVTTNMDVTPTLASILGAAVSPLWRGRDLSTLFNRNSGINLKPLQWIVADGQNSTGVFSPLDGRKYVKQFAPDTPMLFRTGFPWRETVLLEEGDYFAQAAGTNGELWTRYPGVENARSLKRALWENTSAQRVLTLEFMGDGKWEYKMFADVNAADDVHVEQIPQGISMRRELLPQGAAYVFQGWAKAGERLEIGWRKTQWRGVDWDAPFALLGCSDGRVFTPLTFFEELRHPRCTVGELPPLVSGDSLFRARVRVDVVESKNVIGIKAFTQEKSSRNF